MVARATKTHRQNHSLLEAAASGFQLPLHDDMGRRKFTGHSLRITGPQFLASQGLPGCISSFKHAGPLLSYEVRYVQDSPLTQIT
eukprot:3510117-Amphidinium_carterae.2